MSILETCNKIRLQDKLAKQQTEVLFLRFLVCLLKNEYLTTYWGEIEKLFELFKLVYLKTLTNLDGVQCDLQQILKVEFLNIRFPESNNFEDLVEFNFFIYDTLMKLRKIQDFLNKNFKEFHDDLKTYYMISAQVNLMQENLNKVLQKL